MAPFLNFKQCRLHYLGSSCSAIIIIIIFSILLQVDNNIFLCFFTLFKTSINCLFYKGCGLVHFYAQNCSDFLYKTCTFIYTAADFQEPSKEIFCLHSCRNRVLAEIQFPQGISFLRVKNRIPSQI
jgi:hypothetical protein